MFIFINQPPGCCRTITGGFFCPLHQREIRKQQSKPTRSCRPPVAINCPLRGFKISEARRAEVSLSPCEVSMNAVKFHIHIQPVAASCSVKSRCPKRALRHKVPLSYRQPAVIHARPRRAFIHPPGRISYMGMPM